MNPLGELLSLLSGYRTYLSAAASIASAVATVAGFIDPGNGAALAAACLALSQIFQRLAAANHQLTISELVETVKTVIEIAEKKQA